MATLMDWLLQKQQRGYGGSSQQQGPGALEILSQSAARGYSESPEMTQYRAQQVRSIPGLPAAAPAAPLQRDLSPYGSAIGVRAPDMPPPLPPALRPYGTELGIPRAEPAAPLSRDLTPQRMNFSQLPGYEGEGALPATAGRQVSQTPMGPVNMNVIKGLNQYAQMGDPQAYAAQFAKGDLSKVKARTYRDEEGNAYNDYYVSGLLGG